MKMFNRSSTDRDGLLADNQRGHKKTDSVLSDVTSRRDGVVKPLEVPFALIPELASSFFSPLHFRMQQCYKNSTISCVQIRP
jgi:hypothetical protein